jgi:protein phosphatase
VFEYFRRLFPDKKEIVFQDDPTLPVSNMTAGFGIKPELSETVYRVASCQSTGMIRAHNEDSLFVLNSLLDGVGQGIAFGIFLVADGMGGHQSGEVASHLAALGASQSLMNHVYEQYLFDRKVYKKEDVFHLLNEAVEDVQNLIKRRVPGGGTTLTLVLALGEEIYSAHVGDSRLYVIDGDGQIHQKTKDHSLVKRLVDLGEITELEALVHPQRNVLYRALGQMDELEADLDHFTLKQGQTMMICSDGLWGVLEHDQMQRILTERGELNAKAKTLVKVANDAGGPDNITVVLVERITSSD